jgi:hypothetical protein
MDDGCVEKLDDDNDFYGVMICRSPKKRSSISKRSRPSSPQSAPSSEF